MVCFRHKCLLKIYIFILKIFSFSFERTKENEPKELSSLNVAGMSPIGGAE